MPDLRQESTEAIVRKAIKVCVAAALCAILVLFALSALSACASASPPSSLATAGGDRAVTAGAAKPAPEPAAPPKAEEKISSGGARAAEASDAAPAFMTTEPEAHAPRPALAPALGAAAGPSAPGQSGLKAGYSDDNEQFNYFVKFLEQYKQTPHAELAIGERIVATIKDEAGKPLSGIRVSILSGDRELASGLSYADGKFAIYPLEFGAPDLQSYTLMIERPSSTTLALIERAGPRSLSIDLSERRAVPNPLPVDVLFVLDTTGSMGEEIERLRSTIEIINANIAALKPKPALRFGMVLYRDREDEYVTKTVPFTADLDAFRAALDEVNAGGGGDTPEDLQAALDEALRGMQWNSGGIRLGFIVTDAPPHLDYGQDFDYAAAARAAKAAGIKFFGIGTGGLPLEGEYVLRQLSQYTQGKYIFLTYGEAGEAVGGKEGSVSHHTGSNFTTDKLEAVIIRFVKEEIAFQSEKPLEYDESYYAAKRVADESREDSLGKLFAQALQGLSDYSTFRLTPETRLAVMPLAPGAAEGAPQGMAAQAEYLGSQLALAASSSKLFTMVERKDLQKVLDELELQLSGLADEGAAAKVGKLLGAEVLVTGTVFRKGEAYEVFLKLVRVETAEVLSANKAKISAELGL